ncbi:MAG: DUF4124 domain-containing protein [Alcanivoracaceae bacterium]
MRRTPLWVAGILALTPVAAPAELYRWTDDSGRVHFSDRPPEHSHAEVIDTPTLPVMETDADTRARQQRLQRFQQAQAEQQQQEQKEADAARREREKTVGQACRKARADLKVLSGRVRYRNPDGSLREVSPQEVAKDRDKVNQWIAKNCAGL